MTATPYPMYNEFKPTFSNLVNLTAVNVISAVFNVLSYGFVEVLLLVKVTNITEDFASFDIALPVVSDLQSAGDVATLQGSVTGNPTTNDVTVIFLPAVNGVVYPFQFRYARI